MNRVELRIATPRDSPALDELDLEAGAGGSWRYGGGPLPEPSVRYQRIWSGANVLRLVEQDGLGIVGYVAAYDGDVRSGTYWVAATFRSPARRAGVPVIGIGLFLNHLFTSQRARWLYLSFTEETIAQVPSLSDRSGFRLLGRLQGRRVDASGRRQDELIYGVEASGWMQTWGLFIRRYNLQDPSYASALARELGQREARP